MLFNDQFKLLSLSGKRRKYKIVEKEIVRKRGLEYRQKDEKRNRGKNIYVKYLERGKDRQIEREIKQKDGQIEIQRQIG